MTVLVFPVGIVAAIMLGLGYVLQQRVAATIALSELMTVRLVLDLMRRKLWWAGIGSMVLGELFAGLALQLANVGLVEPLLSTNLLFALVFANLWCRRRICWQEVSGAVLLSAALGVFIAVGHPQSASSPEPSVGTFVLTVASVLGAVAILVAVARRRRLVVESVLLATGAGLLYGLQDAGTRAALVVADKHGIAALLRNPWAYIVVGAAVLGLLLSQNAFKAARLDYSLPPIAAAEPLAGVLLGVTVLGDTLSVTVLGLAVEAACLAAMVAGVALIGRSPGLAGHHLARSGTIERTLADAVTSVGRSPATDSD